MRERQEGESEKDTGEKLNKCLKLKGYFMRREVFHFCRHETFSSKKKREIDRDKEEIDEALK